MENSEDGSDLLLGAPARDACAGDTQGRAHASERPPPPRTCRGGGCHVTAALRGS